MDCVKCCLHYFYIRSCDRTTNCPGCTLTPTAGVSSVDPVTLRSVTLMLTLSPNPFEAAVLFSSLRRRKIKVPSCKIHKVGFYEPSIDWPTVHSARYTLMRRSHKLYLKIVLCRPGLAQGCVFALQLHENDDRVAWELSSLWLHYRKPLRTQNWLRWCRADLAEHQATSCIILLI